MNQEFVTAHRNKRCNKTIQHPEAGHFENGADPLRPLRSERIGNVGALVTFAL